MLNSWLPNKSIHFKNLSIKVYIFKIYQLNGFHWKITSIYLSIKNLSKIHKKVEYQVFFLQNCATISAIFLKKEKCQNLLQLWRRKISMSNLKVPFQFSSKFPTSCHQQTGKVIISLKECLTINNIKGIWEDVVCYICTRKFTINIIKRESEKMLQKIKLHIW